MPKNYNPAVQKAKMEKEVEERMTQCRNDAMDAAVYAMKFIMYASMKDNNISDSTIKDVVHTAHSNLSLIKDNSVDSINTLVAKLQSRGLNYPLDWYKSIDPMIAAIDTDTPKS
jgi:hypothetical protein